MSSSNSQPVTSALLDEVARSLDRAKSCLSSSTSQLRKAYQLDEKQLYKDTMRYRCYLYTECVQYGTQVYPRTTQLVSEVRDMLEYYVYLDLSEFGEVIDDIRA